MFRLCGLKGHGDTGGGPNHLEKRELKGIRPHLLGDDWEHLASLSDTHVVTLSQDIHTRPLGRHAAIRLVSNLGSNALRQGRTSALSGAAFCLQS